MLEATTDLKMVFGTEQCYAIRVDTVADCGRTPLPPLPPAGSSYSQDFSGGIASWSSEGAAVISEVPGGVQVDGADGFNDHVYEPMGVTLATPNKSIVGARLDMQFDMKCDTDNWGAGFYVLDTTRFYGVALTFEQTDIGPGLTGKIMMEVFTNGGQDGSATVDTNTYFAIDTWHTVTASLVVNASNEYELQTSYGNVTMAGTDAVPALEMSVLTTSGLGVAYPHDFANLSAVLTE